MHRPDERDLLIKMNTGRARSPSAGLSRKALKLGLRQTPTMRSQLRRAQQTTLTPG
jgi:hypothetical protein